MHRMSDAEAREFLARGSRTATFTSIRPDGRPHATPTWYLEDGDDVVFTSWHESVKVRNVRANPNVALVVQDPEPPFSYVAIEGTAELIDDPAECRRIATILGGKYMGAERAEEFGARNGVPGELVLRIHPRRVFGFARVSE